MIVSAGRARLSAVLLFACAALLLTKLPAAAGGPDRTRYFPLDHPAYDYISRLQESGYLLKLNPSLRPYTRAEVLEAVLADDLRPADSVRRGWLEWLRDECDRELESLAAADSGNLAVVTRLEAGGRLKNIRPERDRSLLGVGFGGTFGRVVFDSRFARAPYLMAGAGQADHRDPAVVPPDEDGLIRPLEGYLTADLPVRDGRYGARIFFGRLARNWSPDGTGSLILSGRALSFDHLALRLTSPHLVLSHLVASLDPVDYYSGGSYQTARARRFLSAHRLDIRVRDHIRFGITETTVYGGPGAGWEPALMNPFTSYRLLAMQDSDRWSNNSFVAVDFFTNLGGLINLRGQMLFDDFLRNKNVQDRWALSLGADICRLPLPGASTARLAFERVSSYAYNTFNPWERYLISGRPLGADGGNDYQRFAGELRQYLHPEFDLTVSAAYTERGALRISSPIGGLIGSAGLPFPTRPVEHSFELSLALRWQARSWCHIKASAGLLDQSGVGNVAGLSRRRGAGEVELSIYRDFLVSF